jgi:anti-sigma B factor antagonist
MQVVIEQHPRLLLVAISGRLDTASAPAFDAELAPLLAQPNPQILLDLTGVSYISSAGLRSMLQLVKHASAHAGRLGIFGASPQIMEVVEISGFPSLMDVYPDRTEALESRVS